MLVSLKCTIDSTLLPKFEDLGFQNAQISITKMWNLSFKAADRKSVGGIRFLCLTQSEATRCCATESCGVILICVSALITCLKWSCWPLWSMPLQIRMSGLRQGQTAGFKLRRESCGGQHFKGLYHNLWHVIIGAPKTSGDLVGVFLILFLLSRIGLCYARRLSKIWYYLWYRGKNKRGGTDAIFLFWEHFPN